MPVRGLTLEFAATMSAVTLVRDVADGVATLNGVAACYGAWRWWRVEQSRTFWWLARVAQVAAGLFAGLVAVLVLSGSRPHDSLFYLYALLPLAIGFIAEQLRVVGAQQVLDGRGLEDASAVGELPETDQRSIVVAILRREMGVIALSLAVVSGLALRAGALW